MSDLQISLAIRLVMKTGPILAVRMGAYLVFWFVALVYLAIVGGIAYLIGQAIAIVGFIILMIGLAGMVPIYRLAKQYVFYLIKAAHIAVIAEYLVNGRLPKHSGGQLAWGKEQVQNRFGEVSAMFIVDELVEGIVRRFTATVYRVARWLPGDNLRTLVQVVNRIIRNATTYIDEAILARTFWTGSNSVWASAQDGVVLYAMAWKPLLKNAVALMVVSYIPFFLFFAVIALPVGLALSLVSTQLAGWALIALLVLAYLVKVAVGDTIAMTAMIASYQRATDGLTPDPIVSAKLDRVSDKFGELKQRAKQEMRSMRNEESDTAVTANPAT